MIDGWERISADTWRYTGSQAAGICTHDAHRGHEWVRPAGPMSGPSGGVCGICHPPPPAREEKQDG